MTTRPDRSGIRDDADVEVPEYAHRENIEQSVMLYIGGVTAAAIAGYAVYRFAIADFTGALLNTAIFSVMAGVLLMSRSERYVGLSIPLFGLVITSACVASSLVIGTNGLLWAFLVFWVNIFLLKYWVAIALNGTAILVLSIQANLFDSLLEQVSWSTVAVLICAFGLVFSRQLRQQRRMLRHLATRDPLTGIGNRRLMQHQLDKSVAEFQRHKRPCTLVVLDLDHFKRVNDSFGHEAGDKALRNFTRQIRTSLRTEDELFRMGGEEFVLLLRDMDQKAASEALPELHRRLSGTIDGPDGPLRFSAGAATLAEGENWSRWLGRADNALYKAKRSGRDALIIAEAS